MKDDHAWWNRSHDWVLYSALACYTPGVVLMIRRISSEIQYYALTGLLPALALVGLVVCQMEPTLRNRTSPFARGMVLLGIVGIGRFAHDLLNRSRGLPAWLP